MAKARKIWAAGTAPLHWTDPAIRLLEFAGAIARDVSALFFDSSQDLKAHRNALANREQVHAEMLRDVEAIIRDH